MNGVSENPIDWSRKDQAVFEFWLNDMWHGYLALREKDWQQIINGDHVMFEGMGFIIDDIEYDDFWEFQGGLDGKLVMYYHHQKDNKEVSQIVYEGKPRTILKRALPI